MDDDDDQIAVSESKANFLRKIFRAFAGRFFSRFYSVMMFLLYEK